MMRFLSGAFILLPFSLVIMALVVAIGIIRFALLAVLAVLFSIPLAVLLAFGDRPQEEAMRGLLREAHAVISALYGGRCFIPCEHKDFLSRLTAALEEPHE